MLGYIDFMPLPQEASPVHCPSINTYFMHCDIYLMGVFQLNFPQIFIT